MEHARSHLCYGQICGSTAPMVIKQAPARETFFSVCSHCWKSPRQSNFCDFVSANFCVNAQSKFARPMARNPNGKASACSFWQLPAPQPTLVPYSLIVSSYFKLLNFKPQPQPQPSTSTSSTSPPLSPLKPLSQPRAHFASRPSNRQKPPRACPHQGQVGEEGGHHQKHQQRLRAQLHEHRLPASFSPVLLGGAEKPKPRREEVVHVFPANGVGQHFVWILACPT